MANLFYGDPFPHHKTMSLSENIDDDSFASAHGLTLSNVPQDQLETEFVSTLTRHLISALDRAGVPEVKENRERSARKVQAALEEIRQTKGQEWLIFMQNRSALRMALEHVLASRITLSEMPPSIRKITQKFSAVTLSDPFEREKDGK